MTESAAGVGGRTYFDKVWDDHVIADLGENTALLHIDRLFLHEMSGSVALERLERSGRPVAQKELVFSVIDHVAGTLPGRREESPRPGGTELIHAMRRMTLRHHLSLFDLDDPRQGIVHVVAPAQGIALPGLTLVCGDSHTCTQGGVGTLAWGIGSTECEHVLATQTLAQTRPKNMRVRFEGTPAAGVYPKDMILALIGQEGAQGGIGYAVEFAGSAIAGMPVEGRLTVCNMAIEFSAKYGFVPPDDVTANYLRGRPFAPRGRAWDQAIDYWRALRTDPDAVFDREVEVNVDALAPQVTWGTSPQLEAAVDAAVPDPSSARDEGARNLMLRSLEYMHLSPGTLLQDVAIDGAFIGSCTNSRLSDLRIAAEVLKGRRVADDVVAICVPGSTDVKMQAEAEGIDRVFREAGFEWRDSACSYCAYIGGDEFVGKRTITSTNRNFENRQGPKTRSHLASPATVAASALAGRIADPREYLG